VLIAFEIVVQSKYPRTPGCLVPDEYKNQCFYQFMGIPNNLRESLNSGLTV